ncbi:hypothetical protein AXG93_2508s1100 [Marchantia polymorpha subsp. ruderalis]|uniref:U1-type domain-containing protein n=1 Tax=Marchantia polymorpha subsp. ruderalis TaxID=1480154 RepID=A0A176WDE9_MARPO|nr:hypothetical protein AXG93_2508s1100 [Marchantia polymorpha subsp. ruderalis]
MDPKALLDELMGKDRDLPLDQQKKKKLRFDDPEVCHFHLVSFCPHDLFPNTKSDLGACEKIHDDALRAEFIKSNRVSQYEAEFLGYLERLIADLERKIKRCHERLDKEMPLTEHARANSDRISAIAMEVQVLLKQAEREGEDGLVDQAQATMNKVDLLNKEKDQLVRAVMPEFGNILEKEKRMQVCEVCGAMQASTDTEKRLASHLEGKQHLGYFRIRQTADQLRKKKEEEREARRKEREVEKVDGVDQKPKLEEVPPSEDLKDKEKILNGVRPYDKERENDMRREHENRRERRYAVAGRELTVLMTGVETVRPIENAGEMRTIIENGEIRKDTEIGTGTGNEIDIGTEIGTEIGERGRETATGGGNETETATEGDDVAVVVEKETIDGDNQMYLTNLLTLLTLIVM